MNSYHKWILTGVLATSVTAGFADQARDQRNMNTNMQSADTSREITPSASPMVPDGARFFFSGDFIYWQAQEDNLIIGSSGNSLVTVAGATYPLSAQGSTATLGGSYSPGFKFGMGLDFQYDGWDTFANYTWYQVSDSGSGTGVVSGTTLNSKGAFSGNYFQDAVSATGKWNLYFNVVDWELGRKFFVSKRLTLRPHAGLKGAWNHQNLNTYELATGTILNDSFAHTYQRQKFWGVGFRTGLNTEWRLGKGFSIYGDFAFAELYGQFNDTQKIRAIDVTNNILTATDVANVGYSHHSIKPVAELAMGFRYDVGFGDDNYYRFLLQAGWEQQIWWNQNQFITASGGDLSFQGLDVKMGFTF